MRIHFKIPQDLYRSIHKDLARPHDFSEERLGFILCRPTQAITGTVIVAQDYLVTRDEWYIRDPRFGCVFNTDAMRAAMQAALTHNASIFHVHAHQHRGVPWFSRADLRESAEFVPNFWHVRPALPHGTLVFSTDRIAGLCWYPGQQIPQKIQKCSVVGSPLQITQEATWRTF